MPSFHETLVACAGEDQMKNAKDCAKLADEMSSYSPRLAARLRDVADAMFDLQHLAADILRTQQKD